MALWILTRPRDKAAPTEQRVAEILAGLPDTWLIRWGFLYSRHSDEVGEHEGDFLIQGPSGHVLVLEVKGTRVRNFVLTGHWEGETGGESPWVQLNEEWKWATNRADSVCGGRPPPFFHRALALPFVHFVDGDRFLGEVPRECVLGAAELQDFLAWWQAMVARVKLHSTPAEARGVFYDAFGEGLRPKAIKAFIRETEGLFERSASDDFRILKLLGGNRQLLVQGGSGSGKTGLALRQAVRLAESGQRTLVLCYNLALADHLRLQVAKKGLATDRLEVMSWEELTGRLLALAGIPHDPPVNHAERSTYYTATVPGLILEVLKERAPEALYDALVVDEAQDHDTAFPPELGVPDLPGWWHFYFSLLRGGTSAPMALFYDLAQRPRFRGRDAFDPQRLRRLLSQSAHLRLPSVHRYTRPVFEFLQTLAATGARQLVTEMGQPEEPLPEGPETEVAEPGEDLAQTVAAIARRWEQVGFCRLKDIVVLGPRSRRDRSGLGATSQSGAVNFTDYRASLESNEVRYLSINKAKGLDFLGVIVIDLPPPESAPDKPELHELLFMGASRARQLLAFVRSAAGTAPAK